MGPPSIMADRACMGERPDVERMFESTLRLLRMRGYRKKTVEAYLGWLRRSAAAHPGSALQDLDRRHVEEFLSVLTNELCRGPEDTGP